MHFGTVIIKIQIDVTVSFRKKIIWPVRLKQKQKQNKNNNNIAFPAAGETISFLWLLFYEKL